MRLTALFAVLAGVLLAVGAVYAIAKRTEAARAPSAVATRSPAAPKVQLATIVVADQKLAHGDRLSKESLKLVEWPQKSVPEGAFKSVSEIFVGHERPHRVLRGLERGEPVLRTKLSGFSGRATIASKLSPGMRAVSIRVNDVSGVGGFLLPGDHVDVMLTRRNESEDLVTGVILQNMTVIGVDQIADEDMDKPRVVRTVTVEAGPEDAQKLALAMEVGTLSLTLRQAEETAEFPAAEIDVRDLSGPQTAVAAPEPVVVVKEKVVFKEAPVTGPPTVRIRRGSQLSEEPMLSGGGALPSAAAGGAPSAAADAADPYRSSDPYGERAGTN